MPSHTPPIEIRTDVDLAAAAKLYNVTVEEMTKRDEATKIVGRWFAYQSNQAVGVATATRRVDERVFIVDRCADDAAYGELLAAATDAMTGTHFVSTRSNRAERIATVHALGFGTDLVSTNFNVPFAPTLDWLRRCATPSQAAFVPADQVNADQLYELDIELRNDVPGTDGWRGNRAWFDDEMAGPEFDPAGYCVAKADDGSLIGLCRFWRNEQSPRLGLLAVKRPYRTGRLALGLLHAAAQGASTWGSPTFETHTARPAMQRRLRRLGAVESGGVVRLRRSVNQI